MTAISHQPLLQGTLLEEQIELETMAVQRGVKRYRELAQEAIDRGDGASLKPAERLLVHWFSPLRGEIAKDQREIRRGVYSVGANIFGPAMLLVDSRRLTVITLHTVLSRCMAKPSGSAFGAMAYEVGAAVIGEAHFDALRREKGDVIKEVDRLCRKRNYGFMNRYAKRTLADPLWSRQVCVSLGARLLYDLLITATLHDAGEQPRMAFVHEVKQEGKRKKAYIRLSDEALDIIERGHSARQFMQPRHLPMLVSPYEFGPGLKGGYIKNQFQMVSKVTPAHLAALQTAHMPDFYDGFNAAALAAWRMDQEQFRLMEECDDAGGGELGIPHTHDFPMPPEVETTDEAIIAKAKADRVRIYKRNVKLKGDRETFHQKMLIGRLMLDRPRFFMPLRLDFRGRGYPIVGGLNHQGDDVSRGMLTFAEAKPADQNWLKVHAANTWGHGVDKQSFEKRVAWVDQNIDALKAAGTDPLANPVWKNADESADGACDGKPWQMLAACRALFDPEVGNRLPVQLDMVSNGLQHYTAMGCDEVAAPFVGLEPGTEPGTLYGHIAGLAKVVAEDHAKSSNRVIAFKDFETEQEITMRVADVASTLLPVIGRNTCKNVIMIVVYGATMVGSRKAVRDKLKKLGFKGKALYAASVYLAEITRQAMASVCSRADAIMQWLKEIAGLTLDFAPDAPLAWTTSLGFPVVQPYRIESYRKIKTAVQMVSLRRDDDEVPIKRGKSISSFAPNFVHSIDSTHWLMVARRCRQEGITLAAVHDSYWTHAATAGRMKEIINQEFVRLHRIDHLRRLKDELEAKHPGLILPEPPPRGTFDIERTLDAPYLVS